MTVLTQRMREEMVRRNYAQTTIRTYLMAVEEFRRYANKRLDHLGPDDIRQYQVALLEGERLAVGTVALRISALRFLYLKVLRKRALKDELPYPKNPKWARRLPTILTHRDIEATARYLHVSTTHLKAAVNPIEKLAVSGPANLKRSRKLHKPAW